MLIDKRQVCGVTRNSGMGLNLELLHDYTVTYFI